MVTSFLIEPQVTKSDLQVAVESLAMGLAYFIFFVLILNYWCVFQPVCTGVTLTLSLHIDRRVPAERAAPPLWANRPRMKTWPKVKVPWLYWALSLLGVRLSDAASWRNGKSLRIRRHVRTRVAFPINETEKRSLCFQKYWLFSSCGLSHRLLNAYLTKICWITALLECPKKN